MVKKTAPNWRELVSRIIKSEMTKRKIRYEELSQLLAKEGTEQSAANLRNKINRGILGADLFVQLLLAMNVKQLDREAMLEILQSIDD